MKSLKIYILLIAILGGCNALQVEETPLHIIDFVEAVNNIKEVKLSNCVSSLKYTPFETTDSALLGNIYSHFYADDAFMYCASADLMKCIHIFTRDGKYVKDIGKKGRGPGEYSSARTIAVVPGTDTLIVAGGRKVVFYSLKDGSCLKEIESEDLFGGSKDVTITRNGMTSTMSNLVSGNMVLYNNLLYVPVANNTNFEQTLDVYDLSFNPVLKIQMGKSSQATIIPRVFNGIIYIHNNNLNVINGLVDTIYTLKNNELIPHIAFEYGKYPSLGKNPIRDSYKQVKGLEDEMFIPRNNGAYLYETSTSFFGVVRIPKSIATSKQLHPFSHFIYDKHTGKTNLIKHSEELGHGAFTNDIDGGMPFWPTKHIDNKLYQFVDAVTFIEMSKKYNSPRMKEIAATLTEESNPVMIEATLK